MSPVGEQISVMLNSSQVNELVPDSRYTISVTACIEIACRESEAKEVCKSVSKYLLGMNFKVSVPM